MKSSEGEVVPLTIEIDTAAAKGQVHLKLNIIRVFSYKTYLTYFSQQVEKWLLELETAMKASVHNGVALSFDNYTQTKRDRWVLVWPGQAVSELLLQLNSVK